jgi:sugar lactone lactonase YvrE
MRRALQLAFAAALLAPFAARAASVVLVHAGSAYADQLGDSLKAPEGIACTDRGDVVVADSGNGRLVTYTWKDGKLAGGKFIRFDELGYPTRVQIDRAGNVLVLDQKGKRIVRVGIEGRFGGFVALKDVPVANGFMPVAFKLDGADNLYVIDVASARLVVLDPAGAFVRQMPLPKGKFMSDVAVDARGTVYLVEPAQGVVWSAPRGAATFAPFTRNLKDYLNYPVYLAFTGRGQLLLVDQNGNGLVVIGPDGSFQGRQLGIGWSDGLVYYPSQICTDDKGDVFVADRNNNRIQVFSASK